MIVTAHQPNFLPGKSVIDKIAEADAVIWLDEVQYTKGGFINRNRYPDGSWMTVPVERHTDGCPINRVRLSDHGAWREKLVRGVRQHFGHSDEIDRVCVEIERPYRLLVGLNTALLTIVVPGSTWHFQCHLDGGHAVRAVSEDAEALLPISERLAMMVEEIGGSVYLSGPSGRRYLDEAPFNERGVRVRYYEHAGENPCVLGLRATSRR